MEGMGSGRLPCSFHQNGPKVTCIHVPSFSVESIEKYYYMKRKLCAYVYKLSSLDLNFYFDLAPRLLTAFIFDFILFFDSRSLATLFFAKFMRIIF